MGLDREVAPAGEVEGVVLLVDGPRHPLVEQGEGSLDRGYVNRQGGAIEDQDLAIEQDQPRRAQRQTVGRGRHYRTSIGTDGPSQVNSYGAKHVYAPSPCGLRTSWPLRMIRFKLDGKFDCKFTDRFNRWRSATKSEPRLPRLDCRKAAAPSLDAACD